MESTSDLARRLSVASISKAWDVYAQFDWPERLDDSLWAMSPELVSLHGTTVYDALDEAARRKLAFHEVVNFFSFVLYGERPLLEGLSHRLYSNKLAPEITDYLHHFVNEENRHMVMFGTFCKRYAGKIYPEKKIPFPRDYAPGEEELVFFSKVLVVEELGDYYNVVMAKDERLHPIVREINDMHHRDEARHLVFGRRLLAELAAQWVPRWQPEVLDGFRSWFVSYLESTWRDFYNPSVYRDAGLDDPFQVRQSALDSPVCRAHRNHVSKKLVSHMVDVGVFPEEPALS